MAAYADKVLLDGAIAYWRLGESSGTTAADATGGGRSGTYVGTVTLGSTGALADDDTAVTFDGSSGLVQIANHATLQLAGDLTIELWVNSSSMAARQTLISKSHLREFELTLETNGSLNFYHGNGTTGSNTATAVGVVTASTWHHVVVTRSGSTINFYVNGASAGSGTAATGPSAGTSVVEIGRNVIGGTQYVNGRLD
jgi:hypothetical protein